MGRTALLLCLLPLTAGCYFKPSTTSNAHAADVPVNVVTATVEKREYENVREYLGTITATDTAIIQAPVDGLLLSVSTYTGDQTKDFREGDFVREGDLLFVIARKTELHSRWIAAEALKRRAKRRLAELAGRDGSKEDSPEVTNANSALRSSVAELDQLKPLLDCIELRSPISGIAGEHGSSIGTQVWRDSSAPLSVIQSTQVVYVNFEISESDLLVLLQSNSNVRQRIWEQPVTVALLDQSDFLINGKIDFIDNEVNAETGTIRMRAAVPNPTGILYPGMSVRVRVTLAPPRSALTVAAEAVEEDSGGSFLWLLVADDSLEKRYLQLAETIDDRCVLSKTSDKRSSGELTVDDRYVLNPSSELRDGLRVNAISADSDIPANP